MKIFDLSDDILELVSLEVFKVRKAITRRQLTHEWTNVKRPSRRIIRSGNRALHPGRAFLCKTTDLKDIGMIDFKTKVYICGIQLDPIVPFLYSQYYDFSKEGLHLDISKKRNQWKINALGLKNGWTDFKEQTDNTIIRYLIRKEECRESF